MNEYYRNKGTGEVCKVIGTEQVDSSPSPIEVILIEWPDGKNDRWHRDLFYQHFTPAGPQAGQTERENKR